MPQLYFIGLVTCIFYFPIFLFLLLYPVKRQYQNYSIFSFWISNLGEKNSPSYSLYTISFLIFGLLILFFTIILSGLLPDIIFSKIAILFLYLSSFSTLLVIFFPMDRSPKVHEWISIFLFAGVIGSSSFLIYPIYISNLFPNFLIILNIIILFFAVILTYSFIRLQLKYGSEAIKNLVEIRKIEHSFVLRNATFWEWTTFILLILGLFILSVIIYGVLKI